MPRYIDAEALDNRIKSEWAKEEDDKGYGLAHFFVETQPTADVALVVHGHWEKTGWQKFGGEVEHRCSHCKRCKVWRKKTQKLPYYCEKCGAKMDEET